MTMYAGIFTEKFAKNLFFNEHNIGMSIRKMELLRAKSTWFCGIPNVIPRLKLDDQIMLSLIKSRTELRS